MLDQDPKYQSNTSERAEVAAERIPAFVQSLLSGDRELNRYNIQLLYAEYRAYYRSSNSYRRSITKCHPPQKLYRMFSDWTEDELLKFLEDPEDIGRQQALAALCRLNDLRIAFVIEERKNAYALH